MKKPAKKEKKSTGKPSVVLRVLVAVTSILVVGAFGLAYYTYTDYTKAINPDSITEVILVIEADDTLNTIAEHLKEIRIIKNSEVFVLAARINDKTDIQVGFFKISSAMDCKQILTTINDPEQANTDQVAVTLSPGYGAKDIANAIAEKCDVSSEALLSIWSDEEYMDILIEHYWFIDESIKKEGIRFFLEGYLYPETTLFYKNANPEAITNRLLDNFDEKITPLKDKISASSLSLNEILTLASLIQYDARSTDDLPLIAGVYMKRLSGNMPLQSDATICYVLSNFTDREGCRLKKNQAIASPYNTFKNKGLPIGPVLSPSLKAIEAALDYQVADYIYFLYDSEGKIHLARSYAAQLANQEKYGN